MSRLFVDMDGTLARFHDEYMYLERMYEEGFFKELKPFENMIEGIKKFIKMHPDVEVYALSSSIESKFCREEKNEWMDRYLPEIPTEKRLYPKVGTSKADFVKTVTGIAVTKNDYLLDDYNKGLYDWEAAGGSAVKCHNNINHKGLGAHGGQKGQIWTKAIVHTEDLPVMIASELSAHMELHFDFKPIYEAYGMTKTNLFLHSTEIDNKPVYAWEEMNAELNWDMLKKHANPLDAIRFMSFKGNYRDFEPIVLRIGETSNAEKNKDFCIVPTHKYNAILFNFDNKTVPASEFWKDVLNNSHLPKILDSALNTLPKPSLNNMLKKTENQKKALTKENKNPVITYEDRGK